VPPDQVAAVQRAFRNWMRLRAGTQLITDLSSAMPAP
jgi:hypothetical protein